MKSHFQILALKLGQWCEASFEHFAYKLGFGALDDKQGREFVAEARAVNGAETEFVSIAPGSRIDMNVDGAFADAFLQPVNRSRVCARNADLKGAAIGENADTTLAIEKPGDVSAFTIAQMPEQSSIVKAIVYSWYLSEVSFKTQACSHVLNGYRRMLEYGSQFVDTLTRRVFSLKRFNFSWCPPDTDRATSNAKLFTLLLNRAPLSGGEHPLKFLARRFLVMLAEYAEFIFRPNNNFAHGTTIAWPSGEHNGTC